ncbi:MAG: hypothetical protein H6719_31060 [Sandaracinaceae bacterium]|nr:hypothetical protein [Sandaracinaceae bacterium]
MGAVVRVALVCLAAFALTLLQSRGCGYTPDPAKGEGEPCTRSTECQSDLTCSGGVCRRPGLDAGPSGSDAGANDAGPLDDGGDLLDATTGDMDAAAADPDAGDTDASAGPVDAAADDAEASDAGSDAS